MKQGRETTKEERIEIAKDCLASGKNYGAASFRALYERLIFQNLTYNLEAPCCNEHPIPVLFMMTSNAPDLYCGTFVQ